MKNDGIKAYKKIRKSWEINPRERVVESKKEYDRNEAKKELKESFAELDDYDTGLDNLEEF